MEGVDLLYSGLMLTAGILSVGTGVLLTAALVTLVPLPRNQRTSTATISSRGSSVSRRDFPLKRASLNHGSEESPSPRSLSETLPQRIVLGRPVRLIQ
jgi:hypothetical protein